MTCACALVAVVLISVCRLQTSPLLQDLGGLQNLTTVGSFSMNLAGLRSLAFPKLTDVTSSLSIITTPLLTSLNGFNALKKLGGALFINVRARSPPAASAPINDQPSRHASAHRS